MGLSTTTASTISYTSGGGTSSTLARGWGMVSLGGIVIASSAAGAVYWCYKSRRARAEAAARDHAQSVRRQPLGAKTTDALLSSWRAAHLVGLDADRAEPLRRLMPDELAVNQYNLPRRRSLVLDFRDSSGCSPNPPAEGEEPLLQQITTHARELLHGADQYAVQSPSSEIWRINDLVRGGGGVEKLCVAALVLHGVAECAIEEFVQVSVTCEDKKEFWGSLASSPWLLATHSCIYRTSRSIAKVRQLEQDLRGLIDESALCAGSLHLFLESVAAAVQRHNEAAYTHTGKASAAVLKRDQAKLRADLAAAILELRQCFPVGYRSTSIFVLLQQYVGVVLRNQDEMLRASGETVIVDDVHTIACTKCWCAEAKAIISAINTRCTSLQTRVKSAKFSAGKYNWRNLLLVGVACFATVKLTCGWLFGNRNGPGLREKIANLLESGNNFYELHLLTPMKHICTELLQGAGTSKKELATAPLVDASAAALNDMLATWRSSHLQAVSRLEGPHVAAELAQLPAEELAAQSYQQQCLTPMSSMLRGSLVELLMVQKEQMQLDVLRTLGKTDELMRANQMNMEVSALAPALLGLGGTAYGVTRLYQWIAHSLAGLLPHSRHETSRAIELRWFAKTLRQLDHSFLCGPESLCQVSPPPSYRWMGGQAAAERWRIGVGTGLQLMLISQLMAIANDNPFSFTDDGMMELVLHDLSELRAAWVDPTAKRGVVTRMCVTPRLDLILATDTAGHLVLSAWPPSNPLILMSNVCAMVLALRRESLWANRYRSYLFLQPQDASGWARDDETTSSPG